MRKVLIWTMPFVVAGGLLAGGLVGAAQASLKASPAVGGQKASPFHITLKHENIVDSNLTRGFAGYVTVNGFNPVDAPTPVTCPAKAASCQIDADMAVELLDQSGSSGNQFAICLAVDGNLITCNYTDVAPLDGYFRTYDTIQNAGPYGPGAHTVQTQIYTAAPQYLAYYYSTYHVYKP
jgi:hypothetical protein